MRAPRRSSSRIPRSRSRSPSPRSPPAPTCCTTRPARRGTGASRPRTTRTAIGVDAAQYDRMPGAVITSMIKRADVTVFDTIRAAAEGRFESGLHVFGVADGAVDYVHDGPHAARLPPAVVSYVEGLRRDVVSGRVVVPSVL